MVVLAVRNIYAILVKQREYKNLPILAFYCFSLIAVALRPVYLALYWIQIPIIWNIDWVQQAAKLCVGIVQDWITFELAVRIRNTKGS